MCWRGGGGRQKAALLGAGEAGEVGLSEVKSEPTSRARSTLALRMSIEIHLQDFRKESSQSKQEPQR